MDRGSEFADTGRSWHYFPAGRAGRKIIRSVKKEDERVNRFFAIRLVLLGILATPSLVAASSAGLRAGLSIEPDDFIIGVHFRTDPLAEELYFVPSIEAGFGDITMIAFNGDFHYVFETNSKLRPYAGGGVTVNWFDTRGGSDTEVGGSILGGLFFTRTSKGSMFFEMKLGLGDVPDAKLLVGWNLR